ncbi:MAG: retron St85 family effector protein [Chloroflexota bacterium]
MNPRAEQFLNDVQLGESRVQYPEDVVFFCGGLIHPLPDQFSSLRDFIYTHRDNALVGKRIILAEKAAEAFDSHVYDDLMEFEKFIASIARIVLLISESPGSIAELGAFSQIGEISPKLLVFIHSQFYGQNSFIKDGPVRYLENRNEQSVFEFDWLTDVQGMVQVPSAVPLLPAFAGAVRSFERRQNRTEKFSDRRIGHQILLTAGVVHLLGCCKLREIAEGLEVLGFDFSEKQVKQMIFCLRLFGWVKSVKRDTTYFIYSGPIEAFQFRGNMTTRYFDFERERFDVLQAYDKNDPRLSVMETTVI